MADKSMKIIIIFFATLTMQTVALSYDFKPISFIDYANIAIDNESNFKKSGGNNFLLINHLNLGVPNLGIIDGKVYRSKIISAIIFCEKIPKYLPIITKYYSHENGGVPALVAQYSSNQDAWNSIDSIDPSKIEPPTKYSIEATVADYSCSRASSDKVAFSDPSKITDEVSELNCSSSFYSGNDKLTQDIEFNISIEKNTGKAFYRYRDKTSTLIGQSDSSEREFKITYFGNPDMNKISINRYSGKMTGRITALNNSIFDLRGTCASLGNKLF